MTVCEEYILSTYETVKVLRDTDYSCIEIVNHSLTDGRFIKRTIKGISNQSYKFLIGKKHVNLPEIFHVFFDGDDTVVIEEYIEGKTLDASSMGEADVIKIAMQICDALGFLHMQKPPIIHRDVKPSNVMMCDTGAVKLIDLGASRLYSEKSEKDTQYIGTSGYASPEQYGYKQTDMRSDIFSLGKLMQELLTGDITGAMPGKTYLAKIINKCTHIDPQKRYQTVSELYNELDACSKGKKSKSNNWLIALPVCILLIAASIFTYNLINQSRKSPDTQNRNSGISSVTSIQNSNTSSTVYSQDSANIPTTDRLGLPVELPQKDMDTLESMVYMVLDSLPRYGGGFEADNIPDGIMAEAVVGLAMNEQTNTYNDNGDIGVKKEMFERAVFDVFGRYLKNPSFLKTSDELVKFENNYYIIRPMGSYEGYELTDLQFKALYDDYIKLECTCRYWIEDDMDGRSYDETKSAELRAIFKINKESQFGYNLIAAKMN